MAAIRSLDPLLLPSIVGESAGFSDGPLDIEAVDFGGVHVQVPAMVVMEEGVGWVGVGGGGEAASG